jgi:phospholipid/cholesterol/gamma-HCH transport system permease protein
MFGRVHDRLLSLLSISGFVVRTVLATPSAAFRLGVVVRQFERVMWGSLPLVLVAGVSVGLVTWLQTRRLLERYGSEALLPSILAVAVMVETGPMLSGILVAGRMGAGMAAELGSMVLADEIDAMEILGAPAVPALVAPRVLACAVALPLLTVLLDAAALLSGLAIETCVGEMTVQAYWQRSLAFLKLSALIPATLKTSVFGLVIGLTGCWTGLNSGRSSDSVGRAATLGVVRGAISVFAVNLVLVPLIDAGVAAMDWKG